MTRSEYKKDKGILEIIQCSAMKVIERLEHVSSMEIVKELEVFSLKKRRFRRSYQCVQLSERSCKKGRARLFSVAFSNRSESVG